MCRSVDKLATRLVTWASPQHREPIGASNSAVALHGGKEDGPPFPATLLDRRHRRRRSRPVARPRRLQCRRRFRFQRRKGLTHLPGGQRRGHGRRRRGARRGLPGRESRHHHRRPDAAAGRRRRQPGQDPPRHRRDGRRVPVQLRFAAAGTQPRRHPRQPRRPGWVDKLDENFVKTVVDGERPVRRADRAVDGRCRALQQGHLRAARPRDPDHVGRVHREQRGDQGGRYGRPDRADLRRHLDLAALRARRLQQRARRGPRLGRGVHEQRGQVRRRAGASPGSSTCRRRSRRTSTTRTSRRPRTTTA